MNWSSTWVWDGGTVPLLILAFILSAIIGIEREWWSHACGIRPCILVATGAAAFGDLIISRVPNNSWGNAFGAIATGIGFLGAGAILKEDRRRAVHGLSTAATIWVVAIIGLLVGVRNIESAVALTVLVVLVNVLLRPLAATIARRTEHHRTTEDILDG